ncbi:aromatic-ring-hydroxylating dioxygenase subunit beta [Bradyrhizobium sp. RDT10]
MLSRESSTTLMSAVTSFIYKEARLQDEHRYEEWEALWTDDGVYWVPANGDDIDPEKEMSIIYDNRSRISLRIKQLLTGKRHTQTPQSRLRRLVSNIELLDEQPGVISRSPATAWCSSPACATTQCGPPVTNTGCVMSMANCEWRTRR